MFSKIFVLSGLLAVAMAGVFELQGVAHGHAQEEKSVDYYAHPKYEYNYGVEDGHTGDHKTHHEERDGDVVKGYYTVADPDGTLRTVHYTADDHNGFNAVVERKGEPVYPQEVKKIVEAPVYHH